MASSGAINSSATYGGGYFQLYWTATADPANNRSLIKWYVYFYTKAYYQLNAVKLKNAYVNGSKVVATEKTFSDLDKDKKYTLASGSIYVPHSSNGSKVFSLSLLCWTYSTGNRSGSGTGTLNTISRYSVTSTAGEGGSITAFPSLFNYNSIVTAASTPDTNYVRKNMVLDSVDKGNVASVKFSIDSKNHTVSAYFEKKSNTITKISGGNGYINAPDTGIFDEVVTATIVPDKFYVVERVILDGVDLGDVLEVNIDMNDQDHIIEAYFKKAIRARVGSIDVEEIKVGNRLVIGMMIDNKIIF